MFTVFHSDTIIENFPFVQHCYALCKRKVLEKFHSQLESLFVVSHSPEVTQEVLDDVSIAYGHLMRACRLQSSDQLSEALCEEVSTPGV